MKKGSVPLCGVRRGAPRPRALLRFQASGKVRQERHPSHPPPHPPRLNQTYQSEIRAKVGRLDSLSQEEEAPRRTLTPVLGASLQSDAQLEARSESSVVLAGFLLLPNDHLRTENQPARHLSVWRKHQKRR